MSRKSVLFKLGVALVGLEASLALAQDHANLERGIAPNKAYHIGDIDAVNLFNGNLSIAIPIGQAYHVNGGLSYQLSLRYNSGLWQFWQDDSFYPIKAGQLCDTTQTLELLVAATSYGYNGSASGSGVAAGFNAGLGWTLSLGALDAPLMNHDSSLWEYLSSDGSKQGFYTTLHESESPQQRATFPCNNSDANQGPLTVACDVYYTRDGSYLRLLTLKSTDTGNPLLGAWVELPDGTQHKFTLRDSGCWGGTPWGQQMFLTDITDPFGNNLHVDYSSAADCSTSAWTLTDSQNRTHTVNFAMNADSETPQVTSIVLQAFTGSNPPDDTATYAFYYKNIDHTSNGALAVSCKQDERAACPETRTSPNATASFLVGVKLPDNSFYCMNLDSLGTQIQCTDFTNNVPAYNVPIAADSSSYCTLSPKDLPGTIQKMQLPTGGTIAWTFTGYSHVQASGVCTPYGWPTEEASQSAGIGTRTLCDVGATNCGQWIYQHFAPEVQYPNYPDTAVTTVTSPNGDDTDSFFRTKFCFDASDFSGWDYGLPFSPTEGSSDGIYLSSNSYKGSGTGRALKRSTYMVYEHDQLKMPVNDLFMTDWYNSNRRVVKQRTVYSDDGNKYADATNPVYPNTSTFDGLGHHRRADTAGNFDAGNTRTTVNDYNPASGFYSVNPATNAYTGTFTMWSTASPWILGTYDYATVNENSVTAKTEACFDGITGFLRARRVLKTGSGGNTDLLAVFTPDANGNVASEQYFGGDTQSGTLPTNYCTPNSGTPRWSTLSGETYRIDHTYNYGSLAISQYKDGLGTALPFYSEDYTIDARTGFISQSRDTALIQTNYQYDTMGRLTWEQPTPGNGAYVEHQYFPWSSADNARVETCARPNGNVSACSVRANLLSRSSLRFDGLGRPFLEAQLLPNTNATCTSEPCWNQRKTVYNAMGWTTKVSEWYPNGTFDADMSWTLFSGFDPFGRATTITPPDGTAHNVTMTYTGVRKVKRTVMIYSFDSTGANPLERAADTTETYDRQGRLYQVTESSGTSADTTTTYGYDVGNRLTGVSTTSNSTTQNRAFSYDLRGLLTSETLPELGPGTATYSKYDGRGHTHRVQDGLHDVASGYDRAERITLAAKSDANGNPDLSNKYKEFTYDNLDGNQGASLGKLVQAIMTNPPPPGGAGTTTVTEKYTYGGIAGAISSKQTDLSLTLATTGNFSQSFTQGFTWTDLGKLASQRYPVCGSSNCPSDAPDRSVYTTYTNGFLSEVGPYYATSITYHPNGLVNTVTHAKRGFAVGGGFTEVAGLDPKDMPRPASIATSGVTLPGTGNPADWGTGTYGFDGAGNVKAIGSDSFVYDKVSRLRSATIGGTNEAYTYDAFGNMLTYAGRPLILYPPTTTNRMTAYSAGYDTAGNLTAWTIAGTNYSAAYDAFDKQVKLSGGLFSQLNAYTVDGERVLWRNPTTGAATIELRDLSGHVVREVTYNGSTTWNWSKDYVYRDGLLLATQGTSPDSSHATNGGLRHVALDHLGSPRMLTNRGGEKLALFTMNAWGMDTTGGTQDATERMRFTVHERDLGDTSKTNDDVDYMHARNYPPFFARFTSLDPARGDPKSPQSWNLYAYVRNNSVTTRDLDGREPKQPGVPAGSSIGQVDALDPYLDLYTLQSIDQRYGFSRAGDPLGGRDAATISWVARNLYYDDVDLARAADTSASQPSEASSLTRVRDLLGATDRVKASADQFWVQRRYVTMISIKGPGRPLFQEINGVCTRPGSGCGHTFDLKVGRENAIKFATDTLHIRYFTKADRVVYHWDRYNVHLHLWKHIWVDTIGDFIHGGGL